MSQLTNLLKYRYQKKESSQQSTSSITIASSTGTSSKDVTPSNSPTFGSSASSPVFVSKGSISSPVSSSQTSSPVFGSKPPVATITARNNRGACVLLDSDSDECRSPESSARRKLTPVIESSQSQDVQTHTLQPASTSSSPWLSKQTGGMSFYSNRLPHNPVRMIPNGIALSSSSQSCSSQVSSSSVNSSNLSTSLSCDSAEFRSKVSNLQNLFPDMDRSKLAEELHDAGGSEERATDNIIHQRNISNALAENNRKRKYVMFSPSSSTVSANPEGTPIVKRARPLPPESPITPQAGEQRTSELDTSISPSVAADALAQGVVCLTNAFPGISKSDLETVLRRTNCNVDQATVILSSSANHAVSAEYKAVSLTENVGSIKAFQASRAQARVNGLFDSPPPKKKMGPKCRTGRDMSDSDDDDTGYEGKPKHSKAERDDGVNAVMSNDEAILNFFNTATIDELPSIGGCSKKKAELIVSLRPFENWEDLVSKFENSSKTLPIHLIVECRELLRLRGNVRTLMQRCQKLSGEMESFIAELMSKTVIDEERDVERGYIVKQPSLIPESVRLKPYQMVGLNWLILMHTHGLNGILGDEMGLGKTVQTIAFFAYLLEKGEAGPHIIIAPSSTLDNWLRELKIWCPALKVLMYYGSQAERQEIRCALLYDNMEDFDVIVTTYNMVSGSADDRQLFKKIDFQYAVFDEGHMLKNMSSIRYKSLMKIQAERRLLLTGTPLQNNLIELMSLLAFAMPDMFAGKTDFFKKVFSSVSGRNGSTDSRGNYETETLEHAKRILKPFFLRRLKTEVMQQLPTKLDNVMKLSLAFEQQDLYDDLKNKFQRDVKADREAATTIRGQSGSAMMMQLRKAANHHLLHRRIFDNSRLRRMAGLMLKEPTHRDANAQFVFEDMEVMSDFELHQLCLRYHTLDDYKLDTEQITDTGKFRFLDEVLPGMKTKGDRVLLFSQFTMMLDIVEEYMKSRGYRYLRLDGSTPVVERQELIDRFNNDPGLFIFLLSTKAGGLGINLTAANTVILHDIDFNPYNDKQAEDRCHRIGQNRDVTIYRLIAKNTIEEAMLRCAQAKLRLERDVTTSNKDGNEDQSNDVASLLKEALEMEDVD